MTQAKYATPWRVELFDERVVIVARDGETVTELQPGQHGGIIPTKAERIALAQRMVDAVNDADHVVARDANGKAIPSQWLQEQLAEPARSPDAPWLSKETGILWETDERGLIINKHAAECQCITCNTPF